MQDVWEIKWEQYLNGVLIWKSCFLVQLRTFRLLLVLSMPEKLTEENCHVWQFSKQFAIYLNLGRVQDKKKKEKNAGFLPFCQLSLERCVPHKTLYHFLHFFVSHLKQKSSRHFNHTINAISNSGVHLRISTNIYQTSSFPFTWTEQLFRLTNKLW